MVRSFKSRSRSCGSKETSYAALQSYNDANYIFVDEYMRIRQNRPQRLAAASKPGVSGDEIESSMSLKRPKVIRPSVKPPTQVAAVISARGGAQIKSIDEFFPLFRRTATQIKKLSCDKCYDILLALNKPIGSFGGTQNAGCNWDFFPLNLVPSQSRS